MSTSLHEIQKLMLTAVQRPLTADERMQDAWSDGSPTADIAQTFIAPNDRMSAFDRLEVYNQQYWWRLMACIHEDFRGLRAILGDERFEKLAVAYLESHPSRSWSLRNLGSRMAAFIEANAPYVEPYFEAALDIARMEWARVAAFDDPEFAPLDASELAARATDDKPVGLQPYVHLLKVSHPVDKLMAKLKVRDQLVASNTAAGLQHRHTRRTTVRRLSKPLGIAVHRHNYMLYYKRLSQEALKLLLALREGRGIGTACGEAFAGSKLRPKQQAERVQEWFANWMQLGWFCHQTPATDAT